MACAKIKKQLCFYLGRKPLSSYKMGDELSYWGKERKREHDQWILIDIGTSILTFTHVLMENAHESNVKGGVGSQAS